MLIMVQTVAVFAINNVAVLELLPNTSIEGKISIEEGRHLTDELRRQAVMTLPRGEYSVLTRDNIIALIPPDEKEAECLAESCAIEIGRAIGAEYISQGTIGKFDGKLTISVELYETMGGKLISSIVFESENMSGLLNVIRSEAKPMFQSILDLKPTVPAQPQLLLSDQNSQNNKSSESLNQVNQGSDNKGMRLPQWLGIGFAVAGISAGVYGILQNSEYGNLRKEYKKATDPDTFDSKWKKVEEAETRRNIGYIVGGVLLASGITVYFVF
jgi:TolB-like protein